MKPNDRQKMCTNCDGRIPYDATQCPYCFTTVPAESSKLFSSTDPIYTPPYTASPSEPTDSQQLPKTKAIAMDQKGFLPILLLTLGGNLLTLGLLQFFFSDHGTIQLEINGSYWFLMVLVSIPLFYFGIKTSKTT